MNQFWSGFEKKAEIDPILIGGGAILGSVLGSSLISSLRGHSEHEKETFKALRSKKEQEDSRKVFEAIKHLAPKTKLLTSSDLKAMLEDEKTDSEHITVLSEYLKLTAEGNAAAIHPSRIGEHHKKYFPKIFLENPVIVSGDKINPSVMAHEIGHVIDRDEVEKLEGMKKFLNKFRSEVASETAAWEKAPGGPHDEMREKALGTYKNSRERFYAGLAGALAGGIGGHALSNLLGRKEMGEVLRERAPIVVHMPSFESMWPRIAKKASIEEWTRESEEEDRKVKRKPIDDHVDPQIAASSFTPDTYWRPNP